MNHRERFAATMNHQQVDRPPMDFLGEPWMRERLVGHLGLSDFERALVELDSDFRQISHEEFIVRQPVRDGSGAYTDIWGVRRRPVTNQFGSYDEVDHRPFEDMNKIRQFEDYRGPQLTCLTSACSPNDADATVSGTWSSSGGRR